MSLPIRMQLAVVILAREIACFWGLHKGARQWRVELTRGELNIRTIRLTGFMVARMDGVKTWFFTGTSVTRREGKGRAWI